MKNKYFYIAFLAFATMSLHSCIDTKKFVYFQKSKSGLAVEHIETIPVPEAKIQTDDILSIVVSSMNDQSNEILNFSNVNSLHMSTFPGTNGGNAQGMQPMGYRVDTDGNVVIPFIGKKFIKDLTLQEAADKIQTELMEYLKEPAVNVRFLNHKFSVLGEVNRVGTFNLLSDNITLPEALAMAGDLTVFGRRDTLTVVRNANGLKEIGYVNLLDRSVFKSPYYYIKNGDLIYVEPIKGRVTNTEQKIQLVPIYTGIATTLILILNVILRF